MYRLYILFCCAFLSFGTFAQWSDADLLRLDSTLTTAEDWRKVYDQTDGPIRAYAELRMYALEKVPYSERQNGLLELFYSSSPRSNLRLSLAQMLAGEFAKARQVDSAKKYCAICLDLADNYVKMRELCRINGASAYRYNAEYEESKRMVDLAIQNLEALPKSDILGLAFLAKGNFYHYKHVLDSAMEFYTKSAEIYLNVQDSGGLARAYNNLGIVLSTSGDLDKARVFFKKSLSIKLHLKSDVDIAQSYLSLGNLKLDTKEWDSAAFFFLIADSIYEKFDDIQGRIWVQNNLANSAYYSGNYGSAKNYFLTSLTLAKQANDSIELSRLHANLGWSYLSLDSLEKAKAMFDIGAAIAHQLESYELIDQAHVGLSDYYIAIDDFEKALEEYVLSREAHDKMINEHRLSEIERFETKFSSGEKELRIAKLNEQKAQAELSIAKQRAWIIGLVLGLIALLGAGGLFYIQRKRKLDAQLADKEIEYRKSLLESSIMAEEKERQRIAKDLHDGLVQTMASLKLGVQVALSDVKLNSDQQQAMKNHMAQIDEAANEARNISHQMMPRALQESGLDVALEDMLNKTLGSSTIGVRFEAFGMEEIRLPQAIEVSLYRICQELVNNILKHSSASEVHVQIIRTKTHAILHVEDNGTGFDPSDSRNNDGIGLGNIYSRASAVKGEVNYEKGEPKGTVANVRVPLV